MGNLLIALNVLEQLGLQVANLVGLVKTANAQGRDLTPQELAQVKDAYSAAHAQLDADIAAAAPPGPKS